MSAYPKNLSYMLTMMVKLKRLKLVLKNWNWSVFGDMNRNVVAAQRVLESIQENIQQNGVTDDLLCLKAEAQSQVSYALRVQATNYKEKSGNNWLELGDRCKHFFYLSARISRLETILRLC